MIPVGGLEIAGYMQDGAVGGADLFLGPGRISRRCARRRSGIP